MVIGIIFVIHVLFIIYVFYKRYKTDSLGSAVIDLILIIIIFSVGWSLSTIIAKFIWEPNGFGKHFDRDTISLTILSVAEFFFYRFYFKDLFSTSSGKEK